jgi:hypothetical protein
MTAQDLTESALCDPIRLWDRIFWLATSVPASAITAVVALIGRMARENRHRRHRDHPSSINMMGRRNQHDGIAVQVSDPNC